jgi:hypothetical protein
MKKTKIRHQRTGSVLAMLAIFTLFGLVFSSCESCEKGKKNGDTINNRTTDVVYVPPEKVIAKGKELIAKGKELIDMSDKLIAKAEAVKGKATGPEVSEIGDRFKVVVDQYGVEKDKASASIEFAEHMINGGTKSELNRYVSKYSDIMLKYKAKMAELGLKVKTELVFDPLLFPELANAMDDFDKTNNEFRNGVVDEYNRVVNEFAASVIILRF